MIKNFLTGLTLIFLTSCSPTEKKEKWIWDTQVFNPRLIREGESKPYEGLDTLQSGQRFKAKLYKDFTVFNDSTGINLIKEFNGYFIEIAADTSRRAGIEYSYKKINKFIEIQDDTAFIDIPTDSLFKYDHDVLKWKAGYRVIFTDNSDTTYMVGGKWILQKEK